jgi:hypothetical protein
LKPWFDRWRSDYAVAASALLDMAADGVAVRLGFVEKLRDVADSLSEVTTFRPTIGGGPKLEQLVSCAKSRVLALKVDSIDKIPLARESAEQVREEVTRASRKTADLCARAQTMVGQGRLGELQAEVGDVGSRLAKLSFRDLRMLGEELGGPLHDVGMRMRLVEMAHLELDGLIKEVSDCAKQLGELAEQLATSVNKAVQQGVAPDDRPRTAARG